MASGALRVEVDRLEALPGGLVDVLKEQGRFHEGVSAQVGAGVVFQQEDCGIPALAPGLCDSSLVDPETEKDFTAVESGESEPFGIYRAFQCLPGMHDYESLASDAISRGSSAGYEVALQAIHLDGATVMAGGAQSIAVALANAEKLLAEAGGGFIAVNTYGASLLSGYRGVVDDGGILRTRLGTLIASGVGFTLGGDTNPTTAGGFLLWAVPTMDLFVSSLVVSRGYDLTHNGEAALAEQTGAFVPVCGADITAIDVDPEA